MTRLPKNGADDERAVGAGEASAVERTDLSRVKSNVARTASPRAGELPRALTPAYRLDSLIAVGGMGSVYEGTQLALARKVAIKVLTAQKGADDFRRRFLLEASVSARLAHRNIVTVHDYGETASGELFMVMELLEGETLTSLLARERRLAPARAVRIAIEICRALRAAHRESVAHRDLKPGNVMILRGEEEGDPERVKVLDFGLVKVFESVERGALDRDLTQSETMLGSPRYMAPEQILCEPADNRTDIYSLGVVLFSMLTGELPFAAKGAMQILQHHLHTAAPSLAERMVRLEDETEPPALPSALDAIVQRCMAKAPSDRYQSVDELSKALSQAYATLTGLRADGSTMFALGGAGIGADPSGPHAAIAPSITPTPSPAPSGLLLPPLDAPLEAPGLGEGGAPSRAWIGVALAALLVAVGVGAIAMTMGGGEAERPAAPAPAATRVTVTSEPPGAEVRLDDRVLGTTPVETSLEAAVVGERVELELTLAGHRATRVAATLRGPQVAVHTELAPLTAPPAAEVAEPPPARVEPAPVPAVAPAPAAPPAEREPRAQRTERRTPRAAPPAAEPERPRSPVILEDEARRAAVPVVD